MTSSKNGFMHIKAARCLSVTQPHVEDDKQTPLVIKVSSLPPLRAADHAPLPPASESAVSASSGPPAWLRYSHFRPVISNFSVLTTMQFPKKDESFIYNEINQIFDQILTSGFQLSQRDYSNIQTGPFTVRQSSFVNGGGGYKLNTPCQISVTKILHGVW